MKTEGFLVALASLTNLPLISLRSIDESRVSIVSRGNKGGDFVIQWHILGNIEILIIGFSSFCMVLLLIISFTQNDFISVNYISISEIL